MAKKDSEDIIKPRPPLFWWMLANILAIAFAIGSWVVCLNLFRDPTNETSYHWMLKVGRLEPLKHYEATQAPRPKRTATPLELEAQFQNVKNDDLSTLNQELLRAYVTNFHKAKFLTYAKGDYKILNARSLTEDDFLPEGVVVRAQGMVVSERTKDALAYPVFIECVFSYENADPLHFPVGEILPLRQRRKGGLPDCAAVIHVSSIEYDSESVLNLSVIPLLAVDYKTPSGAMIKLAPPEAANIGTAQLPIF